MPTATREQLQQRVRELENKLIERDQSIKRLERIIDNSLDMIGSGTLDGYLTWINSSFQNVLGYSDEEFLTLPASTFVHHDDVEEMEAALLAARKGKEKIFLEMRCLCKDGSYKWIDWTVLSVAERNRFFAVGRDVTARKRMEQALRESEERYRNIFENLMDVYFETTLDGTIVSSSPSGADLSGYTLSELIGSSVDILYHNPQDRQGLLNELRQKGTVRGHELLFQKKSGELYDVSVNADIQFDEDGRPRGLIGTIRDITKEKKLKEQLERSKKMESIGLMAGGIAHDLNNILSGIVGYPDLLLMELPLDSPLREPVEMIADSGQRAAEVVADLLTVAKGVATGKTVLSLNTVIRQYLRSGEYIKLKEDCPDIVFQIDLDPDVMNILCSVTHMKKILMNLLLNAAEAIKGRGKVVVSTSNRYVDEPLMGYENVAAGEYILLTVSDTGVGISKDDVEMIFEPFFTKKVLERKGTGLGLTVVWNTVREHNGYVNVISDEKGTMFELYFPVRREMLSTVAEQNVESEQCFGNNEKILIVDDEKSQREIASKMLSMLRYRAEAVASGQEALQYLEKQSVDLLVLDMIMPRGLNGRETYEKALMAQPSLKAIITSGYADNEEVEAARKLGAGKYLRKPYTLENIGRAVSEELKREKIQSTDTIPAK